MVKESLDRAGMDAGRKKAFGGKSGMVSWRWWFTMERMMVWRRG
jgi:hypothetical protein